MSFADPRIPRGPSAGTQTTSAARSGRAPGHADAVRRRLSGGRDDLEPLVERPRGRSYRRAVDWEHVGLVGAGLLVGALIGAGTALLLAPQSGHKTRGDIGRRARFARERANDAWDNLADELAAVTRRGRRGARRMLTRARWRASDVMA
jgi:hypothetical protein